MTLTKDSDILSLTHTDLDGHGPEIVERSLGFNPKVVNLENTRVDSYIEELVTKILNGSKPAPEYLFITDIAPNEEVGKLVDLLHQSGKTEIHLFDHHPTALHLNQYAWANVIPEEDGVKQCGTSLFYRFLKDVIKVEMTDELRASLDIFVKEIQLYDTWAWEEQNHTSAKTLNDLFYLAGHKEFNKTQIQKIQCHDTALFSPEEERLLAVEDRRIEKYLKDKKEDMVIISDFFTDENGKPWVAGVVQADRYNSELGHSLCKEYPEIDFALLLDLTHDKASLRAVKEDVDLTIIAKRYEGGGHPPAAGCKITPMGMEFLQKVFMKVSEKE